MGKEEDLRDVMTEDLSRGKKRPVKALSLEEQRKLKEIVDIACDRNCSKEKFSQILEKAGLSVEQLRALWDLYDLRHMA